AVGMAAAIGALLGLREGIVRYRAAMLIGGNGMLLAPLGVRAARSLPDTPLMIAFAGVLAWVAWRSIRQGARGTSAGTLPIEKQSICMMNPATGRLSLRAPCTLALAATGALSGMLSGLLGVGGGFVIVPMLSHISNVSMRGIVATSLAVIALVSVGGVVGAATQGTFPWSVALPFAGGAVMALLAGRQFGTKLAGARLQQLFGIVAGAVAVLLLARATGFRAH
ncbi:MAG TPA: sulfite exporter TauE/SafE family protein, partial [Burkholderiaceae bacterium]|nr:sulfite exporter TauE/SafE family protein [Burkholderiaceae bacterium]